MTQIPSNGAEMDHDRETAAETALRSLGVPEDVAQQHLARLTAPGTAWAQAAPGTAWSLDTAPGTTAESGTTWSNLVPLRPRRAALRATAAGAAMTAALLSGAGVAAASTAAPGDALYGLKTARERVQLAMARPGDDRARLELRLARTRLAEAAALLRDGKADRAIETLARADAALASATAQGGEEIDDDAAAELDRRVEVLGGLLAGGLPDTAADAAREALDRALDRDRRAKPHAAKPDKPARPSKPAKPAKPSKPAKGDVRPTHPAGKPSARPTPHATQPAKHPHASAKPSARPSRDPGDVAAVPLPPQVDKHRR